MIEEIIFGICVIWFSWRGFRSGVPKMLLGLSILLVSYASTWFFANDLATLLANDFQFSFIYSYIGGAIGVFFATLFSLNSIIAIVKKIKGHVIFIDASIPGALLGAVFGAFIGLFMAWSSGVVVDSITQNQNSSLADTPIGHKAGPIKKLSSRAVTLATEKALKAALPETNSATVEASAALIANPVQITAQLNRLAANEEFNAMLQNPAILVAMTNGDTDALVQHPEFKKLSRHPDVVSLTRSLGVKNDVAGERKMAEAIISAWTKIEEVRTTEEFHSLMTDPEVREILLSKNPVNILSNQKANKLLRVILNPEDKALTTIQSQQLQQAFTAPAPLSMLPEPTSPETTLPETTEFWRWRDASGHMQFSETKPAGVDAEKVEF